MGYRPEVVAVVATGVTERRMQLDGLDVVRLAPGSPFGLARRAVRRLRGRREEAGAAGAGEEVAEPRSLPPGVLRLHRWFRTLDFYRLGIGLVLRRRPALVHCNDYNTMWIGAAARLLTPATVVYDSHELWPDRNLRPEPRWWLLACEALLVRCAHRVVAASPGYADVMERRYRIPRPAVVRNVPPARPRDSIAPPPARDDGHALSVYVGGITANRGLEQTVTALRDVPEVRLRLLGPGRPEYVAGLLEHARREGVADRVELTPPVAPTQVVETLEGADVGLALIQPVCLSYRLTAPNKIFEYAAAGVPSLGSDFPVIREFVEGWECGLVADPEDPAAIARALRRLVDPEWAPRFRAGAERAARSVTWEREKEVLVQAYREAAAAT
jgi:glycosyltransferase involved in cell wall biosynthesis